MRNVEPDGVATEGNGKAAQRRPALPKKEAVSLDATQCYMRDLGRYGLLSAEEELHLARQVRAGDAAARQRLIECNLRLVVKLSRNYVNRGLPLLDLIAEGNLGLMHGIEKFDPELGFRLSTYVAPWISHYIERSLMNHGRLVRLPVHVFKEYKAFDRTVREQTQKLLHAPTAEELARRLNRSAKDINRLLSLRESVFSLNAPIHDDSPVSFSDALADPNHTNPLHGVADANFSAALDAWLDQLPPRQQKILLYRFGLRGHEELTLEVVGERLGMTRERVRQIQNVALQALQDMMLRSGHSLELAVS